MPVRLWQPVCQRSGCTMPEVVVQPGDHQAGDIFEAIVSIGKGTQSLGINKRGGI